MKILLVDSTSSHCYVAVVDDNGITDGSRYNCGTKHSEILCQLVADVLDKAKLTFGDLDCMACGIGTGSFTGIRIGVSTVLGYHRATNLPLIALPSLEVMHVYSGSSAVAMDSGNGYYLAEYDNGVVLTEPGLVEYSDERLEYCYKFDKDTNYIEAYATLARTKLDKGQFVDTLVPLYIRKSQAELNA